MVITTRESGSKTTWKAKVGTGVRSRVHTKVISVTRLSTDTGSGSFRTDPAMSVIGRRVCGTERGFSTTPPVVFTTRVSTSRISKTGSELRPFAKEVPCCPTKKVSGSNLNSTVKVESLSTTSRALLG